jgi:hypothetical protein
MLRFIYFTHVSGLPTVESSRGVNVLLPLLRIPRRLPYISNREHVNQVMSVRLTP